VDEGQQHYELRLKAGDARIHLCRTTRPDQYVTRLCTPVPLDVWQTPLRNEKGATGQHRVVICGRFESRVEMQKHSVHTHLNDRDSASSPLQRKQNSFRSPLEIEPPTPGRGKVVRSPTERKRFSARRRRGQTEIAATKRPSTGEVQILASRHLENINGQLNPCRASRHQNTKVKADSKSTFSNGKSQPGAKQSNNESWDVTSIGQRPQKRRRRSHARSLVSVAETLIDNSNPKSRLYWYR